MTVWSTEQLDAVLSRGHVRVHSIVNARVVRREQNAGETRNGRPKKVRAVIPAAPRVPKLIVTLEERFAEQLREAGIAVERQYRWLKGRQYRADFAIPDRRLLIELDGAVHRIKAQWKRDVLKRQDAIANGWTMLPIATAQVRDGTAVDVVRRALARSEA